MLISFGRCALLPNYGVRMHVLHTLPVESSPAHLPSVEM